MGPYESDWVKIVSFLCLVAFVIGSALLYRYIHRNQQQDAPRPPLPTEDEEGEPEKQLPAGFSPLALPVAQARAVAIEQVEPKSKANGRVVCRGCGEAEPEDLIEFEDWQQVNKSLFWRLILIWPGWKRPVAAGRHLYTRKGYCRSCGDIADHKDRMFEEQLALDVAAKRRVWEREGRDAAIRRHIGAEKERYSAFLEEQKREEVKRRAQEYL